MNNPQCEKCGRLLDCDVGDAVISGKVRWYISYRCSVCGPDSELDGTVSPPDDLREEIIRVHGSWKVQFDQTASRALVAKVLRETLPISLDEALSFVAPGAISWVGTKGEAELLVANIKAVGIDAATFRADDDSTAK